MFLKVAAANSGRILNKAAIANRTGVSEPTVSRWLSVLEASGVLFFAPPHFRNFTKRIVKSPKLYFTDTGLLSFLLGIYDSTQLKAHPLYGEIFETFIVSELLKRITHKGKRIGIFYWRDKTGHEIDLVLEHGQTLFPVEIKSASTYNPDFMKTLRWWMELPENTTDTGLIIYDGKEIVNRNGAVPCIPWKNMRV
jgi:predicted AAA+ superfamily ATPase